MVALFISIHIFASNHSPHLIAILLAAMSQSSQDDDNEPDVFDRIINQAYSCIELIVDEYANFRTEVENLMKKQRLKEAKKEEYRFQRAKANADSRNQIIQDTNQIVAELKEENAALQAEILQLRKGVETADTRLLELLERISNSTKQFKNLKAKLERVTQDRDFFQNRAAKNTNAIYNANRHKQTLQRKADELTMKLDEESSRHALQERRTKTMAGLKLLQDDVENMQLFSTIEQKAIEAAGTRPGPSRPPMPVPDLFKALESALSLQAPAASGQLPTDDDDHRNLRKLAQNQQYLINTFMDKFTTCKNLLHRIAYGNASTEEGEEEIGDLIAQINTQFGIK